MRASPLLLLAVLLPLVACAGRHAPLPQPTEEELRLVDYLLRDPFMTIAAAERDADGHLLLTTRQGERLVRYLLAPDVDGPRDLRIHRLDETLFLDTVEPEEPGTGPAPRRLRR